MYTKESFLFKLKDLLFETWGKGDYTGQGTKRCLRLMFLLKKDQINQKEIVSHDDVMNVVREALAEHNARLEDK